MRSLQFKGDTWDKYELLRTKNKRQHTKLKKIIKEMLRGDPTQGIGKPEPLKHELAGLWSRHMDKGNRLIYSFDDDTLCLIAIGGHYSH